VSKREALALPSSTSALVRPKTISNEAAATTAPNSWAVVRTVVRSIRTKYGTVCPSRPALSGAKGMTWICPVSASATAQGSWGGESKVSSAARGWALLKGRAWGPSSGGVLFSVAVGRKWGCAAATCAKSPRSTKDHIRRVLGGLPDMTHVQAKHTRCDQGARHRA
jgi:hypothetical protein